MPDSHLLPYVREVFNLKDGGALGLDFLFPEHYDDESVVVYILPGLTSHSQTCYVKTLVLSIISAGGIAVVHNHRGLGGVPLKNARLYSASNFDDAREVAGYLNQRFPLRRKIVIGTSMGAMVMSKYLATHPEEGKRSFVAALAISSIWDAIKGIESLEKPFINRYIINSAITQNVLEIAVKYKETIQVRDCIDYKKVLNCSNVRDFDAFFTAPSFGHKSAEDYYRDATTLDTISNFSIPVFALNAEDDPFSPGYALPISQAEAAGSNFALITTTRGGHLGYLEGVFPLRRTTHFMERFVAEFVRAIQQSDKAFL
ncbi:unnamed protein product [Allacma fusca]|uniref:Serine aminopeptidase S33 domain-containing protein n=1 Tax=Allacma fusca TaxID=39272 RepID=A0A8J2KUP2_9HEXA|nr:unnamed protein product [Allacma fusca]